MVDGPGIAVERSPEYIHLTSIDYTWEHEETTMTSRSLSPVQEPGEEEHEEDEHIEVALLPDLLCVFATPLPASCAAFIGPAPARRGGLWSWH